MSMKFMKVDSVLAFLAHAKITLDQDPQDWDHVECQDHKKDGDEDDERERLIACLQCLHACCMKRTLTVRRSQQGRG